MAGQDPPKSKLSNALGIIAAQGYMQNLGPQAMAISKNTRQNYLLGMVNAKQRYARENENDPESGRARIHYAVIHNQPERVRELVRLGANIEMPLSGHTPLMLAAQAGHADMVRLLCELGANVNAQQANGETALHVAVYFGKEAAVDALLECGADVRANAGQGMSVLQLAAFLKRTQLMRVLLEHGANATLNLRSERLMAGDTPLHTAVSAQCLECVKILVEAGADLSIRNKGGKTALQTAQEVYEDSKQRLEEDAREPYLRKSQKKYHEETVEELEPILRYLEQALNAVPITAGGKRRKTRQTRRSRGKRTSRKHVRK